MTNHNSSTLFDSLINTVEQRVYGQTNGLTLQQLKAVQWADTDARQCTGD